MITGIKFTKAEALGNDFIVIDDRSGKVTLNQDEIIALCDRRRGVGADGILLLQPSASASFLMRTLNADGTEAEMCGNGIRCAAKFAYDGGLARQKDIIIDTRAGLKTVSVLSEEGGRASTLRVDLGTPEFERAAVPMVGPNGQAIQEPLVVEGEQHTITAVSMGNPHAVVFVTNVDDAPVATLGPAIERHIAFPARTNVEFVQVVGRDRLRMRVWERGAGETDACGTGAGAALAAAHTVGRTDRRALVNLPGGDLDVEWAGDGHIYITGGAVIVFSGRIGDSG
jgi:diaminopimelate epimerase